MSQRAVLVLLVLALACASPAGAADLPGLLGEYQGAAALVEARQRALAPSLRGISPDAGRFELELQAARQRCDELRLALLDALGADLRQGSTAAVDALVAFVGALPGDEPSLKRFRGLCSAAAFRLRVADPGAFPAGERDRLLLALRDVVRPGASNAAPPAAAPAARPRAPIYIAFHWHMHQPIYWPYEDVCTTEQRGVYSYSLYEVLNSRTGPYTSWPFDAVRAAADAGLPNAGASVSFSGSLIEDLDAMARGGHGFAGWKGPWRDGRRLATALGNPRLDLVAFGYHHPLMALIGYEDIRRQVAAHRAAVQQAFGADVPPSKGIFPPENAFAESMIPALVDEGLEWAYVDNIHFTRACKGYPWVKGENLPPPNPADQTNPDPGDWTQLNGLWAPSKVSPWANRPHYVAYLDPATGQPARTPEGKVAKLIAVPTDRYMGNEDGRGGFGALNYEGVMSQLEAANTDPAHPLLIVLHHDGDNYGGGTDGYYHGNFGQFVAWVKARPDRFQCTTVQDYLDRFPPAHDDVIHVEPGSWAGADNGDAEFKKWNGDPDATTNYSPDRNSWGVMTAARNVLAQAEAAALPADAVAKAVRLLMVAQTSCYEYWDGTEMWDSHPTRACNEAVKGLLPQLRKAQDRVGPALYAPQREPYNPGGYEWSQSPEPTDFTVWTYAYDVGGLASVLLRYRVRTPDGGTFQELPMAGRAVPARTNPKPLVKADEYSATVRSVKDALVDYQVVATDRAGNATASPLLQVYVGPGGAPTPAGPLFEPASPAATDRLTVWSDRPAALHWGVNRWTRPVQSYWPVGTVPWADGKAVETPMEQDPATGRYRAVLGPFTAPAQGVTEVDFVLHYEGNSWDKDHAVPVRAR